MPHIDVELGVSRARCVLSRAPWTNDVRARSRCSMWSVPFIGVKMRVPCRQIARALCQNEYAVPSIHHVRPLNRRETHAFRKFQHPRFGPRAVSDRATLGPGNVLLRKVRGHSGHAGNDIADALATEGRAGHAMPSAALILKAKSAFGG